MKIKFTKAFSTPVHAAAQRKANSQPEDQVPEPTESTCSIWFRPPDPAGYVVETMWTLVITLA